MNLQLETSPIASTVKMHLPISKSLEARHLLLSSVFFVSNLQEYITDGAPDDIKVLVAALRDLYRGELSVINVGESGTAMRFLTAYISALGGRSASDRIVLSGEGRLHQRPIGALVQALRQLGADIEYLEKTGFPPLAITPRILKGGVVKLDASKSSQYLSAMMLIAPLIMGHYEIDTSESFIASHPYADMTLEVMNSWQAGWRHELGRYIYLGEDASKEKHPIREGDWTSASYAYLLLALGRAEEIRLFNLSRSSLQGDSRYLPDIFSQLGICTEYVDDGLRLFRSGSPGVPFLKYNCQACPDIVPSVVAACVGLSIPFSLSGVAHLRLKESDRLEAMRLELAKIGITVELTEQTIGWSGVQEGSDTSATVHLDTHGDHRMAMALAPLMACRVNSVRIDNPQVVSKSFPAFWRELEAFGYYFEG